MCANQLGIMRNITSLIKLDVDFLHFDVIDGSFAGNLALNLDIIREARKLTRVPFDVHLMVQNPSFYFEQLIDCGADIIIFHAESLEDVQDNIDLLRQKKVGVGLAMNLDTPQSQVEKYLPYIDYILFMNVKTGFAGQKFNDEVLKKVNYFYSLAKAGGHRIQIISDGGIKLEHVEPLYNSGVDIIVAGTSLLFNERGFSRNLEDFRSVKLDPGNRKVQDIKDTSKQAAYKAAVLHEVGDFRIENKMLRPLKSTEVAVRVMSCGVCGSDLVRVYEKGMYSKCLVPGHEFSGIVHKTSEADRHLLDKRVAVYPIIPCGRCRYCKSGKYNLCENYDYLGSRSDGGFAEIAIVPKENLIAIPNNVSFDEAALLEPLAVSCRGVKRIANLANSDVLVLGLGPIGLLAGMLCKKMGAGTVTGIDRNMHKAQIAGKTGFSEAVSSVQEIKDRRFHVMVDCSGSSDLINQCMPLMWKEGSILLLGNHKHPLTFPPEMMSRLIRGEFHIYSSWNSNVSEGSNDWQVCVNYLARGELDVKPLVTHTFPLGSIVDAFKKIRDKEIDAVKVIINPK